MYSKQEASKIKEDFWTRFGQYMKPVQPVGETKVNWSNYKTGVPQIYFRLRAEKMFASVSIELTHPSAKTREAQYEQFLSMKTMLEACMAAPLQWDRHATDDNQKTISRISATLTGVNIFRESDWPAIISFLKPAIIGLDAFWEDAKMAFE